jgi:hypothetical protein
MVLMLVHYLGSNRRRRPLREVELPAHQQAKVRLSQFLDSKAVDTTGSKQVDST